MQITKSKRSSMLSISVLVISLVFVFLEAYKNRVPDNIPVGSSGIISTDEPYPGPTRTIDFSTATSIPVYGILPLPSGIVTGTTTITESRWSPILDVIETGFGNEDATQLSSLVAPRIQLSGGGAVPITDTVAIESILSDLFAQGSDPIIQSYLDSGQCMVLYTSGWVGTAPVAVNPGYKAMHDRITATQRAITTHDRTPLIENFGDDYSSWTICHNAGNYYWGYWGMFSDYYHGLRQDYFRSKQKYDNKASLATPVVYELIP